MLTRRTVVCAVEACIWTIVFSIIIHFFLVELAKAETYVFENEYAVYARGDFCAYQVGAMGCGETYKAGPHLFVPSADDSSLVPSNLYVGTRARRLVPYEFGSDFDLCNTVADGRQTTCSQNIFFKVKQVSDPDFRRQWHHEFIDSVKAWQVKDTPSDCVIAVLDTGVDCTHPDLKDHCIPGYNAITNTTEWEGRDVNGHGTHVAGIAASVANSIGGIGVSQCKILPVKVLGDSGGGSLYTVMRGVHYVTTSRKARIINMSLGSSGFSSSFLSAVTAAIDSGITVIAAAGNDGTNNDHYPHYPSNFRGVYSVGALNHQGTRASFSNYGKSVDIWAPGVQIWATYPGNRHLHLSGTSMASPVVAGAAGLSGKTSLPDGKLNVRDWVAGEDTPAAPPEQPVEEEPVCKKVKLKRCYKKRCRRYRVYRRMQAWRACRKNCQRIWCTRTLTEAEDEQYD